MCHENIHTQFLKVKITPAMLLVRKVQRTNNMRNKSLKSYVNCYKGQTIKTITAAKLTINLNEANLAETKALTVSCEDNE